jgi:hypothetical protein
MKTICRILLALAAMSVLLSACQAQTPEVQSTESVVATLPPAPTPTDAPPTAEPPEPSPTTQPPPTTAPADAPTTKPTAVAYDLGEATIIQANFPEDSRFREMPVRLNGVMAVPDPAALDIGEGPYPVALILHGTHPGCPVDEAGVDRWPCDPDVERANYAGFEYLVRELAARGYVALSININAENTFGFGEPVGGERLEQIVDLHLRALAEAAAGGENAFGVDLAGMPDMRRLAFLGHSRGGEGANWLAGDFADGPGLAALDVYDERGYGPVAGLLLIAPSVAFIGAERANVPLAVILPACDGDVVDQAGQVFYEAVRHGPVDNGRAVNAPTVSIFLERANHNYFNSTLGGDAFPQEERADCEPLLEPEEQRQFLVDYAADFLTMLFHPDPAAQTDAAARLGMDAAAPAPAEILGFPARLTVMAAGADRRPLFVPADEAGLTINQLGGAVTAEGLTTLFCREGYFLADVDPGSDPCRRPTVTVPGYPAMAVVNWTEPGGALRFELPEDSRDLSDYTTLSLRAAVDPLSPLNAPGAAQSFSIRLTDGAGNTAAVQTRADEPALQFPIGTVQEDEFFGQTFTGRAPMTTIRLPLDGFEGVDLTDVAEIALVFDQSPSGTLFMGDVEVIR